jgi:hypothetical protein
MKSSLGLLASTATAHFRPLVTDSRVDTLLTDSKDMALMLLLYPTMD